MTPDALFTKMRAVSYTASPCTRFHSTAITSEIGPTK
jgi:hypothetical protein